MLTVALQLPTQTRSPRHCPQVDIALVEAGLGGSRDATNVFDPPQLKTAILTAVSLEHQAALGETMETV